MLEIMRFPSALYLAVFGLATLGSSMPVAGEPNPAVKGDAAPGGPTTYPGCYEERCRSSP